MNNETIRGTAQELAKLFQIDPTTMYTLIRLAKQRKLAKDVDFIPSKTGKGKPTMVFEINKVITISIPKET